VDALQRSNMERGKLSLIQKHLYLDSYFVFQESDFEFIGHAFLKICDEAQLRLNELSAGS
jgi:hypothetical protein